MTALYLLFSALAGAGFYLASPHQRLWNGGHHRRGVLRLCAWVGGIAAMAMAVVAMGVWAGIFAALTAVMLVLVLLPYVDAAATGRGGRNDVG